MYLFHEYVDGFFDNTDVDDVPLSPLYAETGMQFEQSQLEALLEKDVYSVGTDESPGSLNFDETWEGNVKRDMQRIQELVEHIEDETINRPVVLYQTPLEVDVGVWPVRSEVDVVILYPTESGVGIRVIEVKSATTAKTHHQMQAAVYVLQFENLLDVETDITASIVAQDSPLSAVVTPSGLRLDRLGAKLFDAPVHRILVDVGDHQIRSTLVELLGLLLDALLALVQRALALVQFGLPAVGDVVVPALALGRDPVARAVGCRPVRRFVTVRGALGGRLVGVLAVRFVDHTRPNMPEHRYTIGAATSPELNLARTRHARGAHTRAVCRFLERL